jgi:hypothetical protein
VLRMITRPASRRPTLHLAPPVLAGWSVVPSRTPRRPAHVGQSTRSPGRVARIGTQPVSHRPLSTSLGSCMGSARPEAPPPSSTPVRRPRRTATSPEPRVGPPLHPSQGCPLRRQVARPESERATRQLRRLPRTRTPSRLTGGRVLLSEPQAGRISLWTARCRAWSGRLVPATLRSMASGSSRRREPGSKDANRRRWTLTRPERCGADLTEAAPTWFGWAPRSGPRDASTGGRHALCYRLNR